MRIYQTPTFKRAVKKLHKKEKTQLDKAIRKVIEELSLGDMKKGDLKGVRVFKYKSGPAQMLLAYEFADRRGPTIKLLALGSHENFYRDLSR